MGKDVTTVQYEKVVEQNRALQQELREHREVIAKTITACGIFLENIQACVSTLSNLNAVLKEYMREDENGGN